MFEFMVFSDGKFINTMNGLEIDPYDNNIISTLNRIERKFSEVKFFPHIIMDNTLYKFDVEVVSNVLKLIVYKGVYNKSINWSPIYVASITYGEKGIVEEGDCYLEFWHEFFATLYLNSEYCEFNVEDFCLKTNHMQEVRKLFSVQLQENIFIFFKKYKNLKKLNTKTFDITCFDNIPPVKINRNVGKHLNNTKKDIKWRNVACQREIEICGDVFFDIIVLTGPVNNGIIDIKEKHRFFITDGYAYSPDGGDLSVFVSNNIYGNVYDNKMRKKYPLLMLDKYSGKYYYQFFFSREYIPLFEICVKSDCAHLANHFLDSYYEEKEKFQEKGINKKYIIDDSCNILKFTFSQQITSVLLKNNDFINIYGKNDKEMLGFKLSKVKNVLDNLYNSPEVNKSSFYYTFSDFVQLIYFINDINKKCPAIFNRKINYDLLNFIYFRLNDKNVLKEIDYLNKIGTNYSTLYKDYLNMCHNTNKYSGGLFPANLKHEHDVMVTYLNQIKEAKNNKTFNEVVRNNDYLSLLYDNDEYCILAPRKADDLVKESYQLSHCVRTYISTVASGSTQIYFLRKCDSKATPLVTIEVRMRTVVQARGKFNRGINNEENNFIQEWCNKKYLKNSLSYYN